MQIRSFCNKTIIASFCVLAILTALPFSFGAVYSALPIGKVSSSAVVSIAGSPAPTGTAVLSGERIAAPDAPALVTFRRGGSVLLFEGAAATFSRNGSVLVIQAEKGTISFNFAPGEEVRIQTRSQNYVASTSGNVGALTVAPDGSLSNIDAGEPVPLPQGSKGNLTKGGSSFTDPNKQWSIDEWKGKSLTINGQKYKIVSNTQNTIKIEGLFALDTGSYEYEIRKGGLSPGAKKGIGIAAAGGAVGGLLVMKRKSK